jgi:hypothetical protein
MKTVPETRTRRSLALAVCVGALALAPACRQTVLFEETSDGPISSTGGGGNGGTGGNGGNGFCASPQMVNFMPAAADVIIALDRSTGMSTTQFGSSPSRLSAAEAALENAVQIYQNFVRFGFVTFPGDAASCTGSDPDCCAGNFLDPTVNGSSVFNMSVTSCDTIGASCAQGTDRALGDALGQAKFFYKNDPDPVARYVLVLTDGPPGCPAAPSLGCPSDATSAVSALLNQAQAKTMFIQLTGTNGDLDPCLKYLWSLAGNGGVLPSATNPDALSHQLELILGPIARISCFINLGLQAPADQLQLLLDNVGRVPNDQNNGWSYQNGSQSSIVLNGMYCTAFIQSGPTSLKINSCIGHNAGP